MFRWSVVIVCVLLAVRIGWAQSSKDSLNAMIASHAAANGVPTGLVHRVVLRESRYNPRAVSRGNYGLMQIRLGTARAMGYQGSAQGLLDPDTNMTYAVRYLAGAYRAAGGNESRAISYYQGGYHARRGHGTALASSRGPEQAATPRSSRREVSARTPVVSSFNAPTSHYAAASRHRSLRYAAARTPSLFDWRSARATSARQVRRSRSAPDLVTTMQRWFWQQRVRTARLSRTALR